MSYRFLFPLALVAARVAAQNFTTDTNSQILSQKLFPFNQIPEQADTSDAQPRGAQSGYNRCNSTTAGPNSMCQTAILNDITDFCIFSSPTQNETIGDTEAIEVAWCTKAAHGGRLIPEGALQGVQFIETPSYVQITGFIDQTQINLQAGDFGGELDSHGADKRGNPLGGLVYGKPLFAQFPGQIGQATEWTMFLGGGIFCLKACNTNAANGPALCQHIYDRLGCTYNVPAAYVNGTFESCKGDDMAPPGIYTSNGQVITYHQPAESLGPITTVPYVPVIPASSQCTTFTSAQIYSGLPSPTIVPTPTTTSTTTTTTDTSASTGTDSATTTPTSTASGATRLEDLGLFGLLVSGAAILVGIAALV